MSAALRLDTIPRGRTCIGVHRAIIEHLLGSGLPITGKKVLDIPCGRGELISSLRAFFPGVDVQGCDISKPDSLRPEDFSVVDASRPFTVFNGKQYDYILSVSGVMEFDNTLQFFENCHKHLVNGGRFVVTNDNVVSVRDRIVYLLFGKVRQYRLFVTQGEGTWKVIPIHNLVRIIKDAGFQIREIKYTSFSMKDWPLIPFAILLYPIQLLHMWRNKTKMPWAERLALYPFKSLLYRHYVILCEKSNTGSASF